MVEFNDSINRRDLLSHPTVRACLRDHGEIPCEDNWSSIEKALYGADAYRLRETEAEAFRFAAIQTSFAYHIAHNVFYRRFCTAAGVSPDDLKDPEDLVKLPLVPEHFFKGSPGPEEFIQWLASISSDEILWPVHEAPRGSYDEQIEVLRRRYGIQVRSTSGSSGIPSFLPRDAVTRRRSAHWKILTYFAMYPELLEVPSVVSITLWPLEFSWADLIVPQERVYALLDKKLGLKTVIRAMTVPMPRRFLAQILGLKARNDSAELLKQLVDQMRDLVASSEAGVLWTPPFLIFSIARFLDERGLKIDFGEHWRVELGGGWKLLNQEPLSPAELRVLVSRTFGIPPDHIYDIYGSTECLGLCALSCEGGYLHIPCSVLHPFVLDDEMKPVGEGKWGRFAYLNPLIQSYPGFIVTEDRVRMLRSCTVCGRAGPVLDGQISRIEGADERGCANIVRQVLADSYPQSSRV